MPPTKFTKPIILALVVKLAITQLWAMACIQVPVIEIPSPTK
jgi:hypothetical protein